MNIIDVINYLYPGQIDLGNVTFRMPDTELLIASWNVPDVPQPLEQDLLDYGTSHERQINLMTLKLSAIPQTRQLLNTVALEKDYVSELSCLSYFNSTNVQWQAEASAFNAWRDNVWNYLFTELDTLAGNLDPIPTPQDLVASIPAIVWP